MLLCGEADIAVATEALASYETLATLPCYRRTHSIVVPPDHLPKYAFAFIDMFVPTLNQLVVSQRLNG